MFGNSFHLGAGKGCSRVMLQGVCWGSLRSGGFWHRFPFPWTVFKPSNFNLAGYEQRRMHANVSHSLNEELFSFGSYFFGDSGKNTSEGTFETTSELYKT